MTGKLNFRYRGKETHIVEYIFVILVLLLMSDALTPFMSGRSLAAGRDLTESDPRKLLLSTTLYLVSLGLAMKMSRRVLHVASTAWLASVLVLLPVLSVAWSIAPELSLRRVAALVLTFIFCLYLASKYSPEEIVRRVYLALSLGCAVSVVMAVIAPQIAIVQGAVNHGAWIGVYADKVMSGGVAATVLLLSWLVPSRNQTERVLKGGGVIFAGALCVMSQSRTAWIMVIAGAGLLVVLGTLSGRRVSLGLKVIIGAALAGGLAVGLAGLYPILLESMGRTATFSGRTKLWYGAIETAKMHGNTLIGYGYRAFWTEAGSTPVRSYIMNFARLPYNGHNGYLDLWLELGWVGVATFTAFMLALIGKLLSAILREPGRWTWSAMLLIVLVFLMNNGSFTLALKHTNIFWATCMVAYLSVSSEKLTRLARAGSGAKGVNRPRTHRARLSGSGHTAAGSA